MKALEAFERQMDESLGGRPMTMSRTCILTNGCCGLEVNAAVWFYIYGEVYRFENLSQEVFLSLFRTSVRNLCPRRGVRMYGFQT